MPSAILLFFFRFGNWEGIGKGKEWENRLADVDRLAIFISRSRICSPSLVDGGARVCRASDTPPRLAFAGDDGEAVTVSSQGNKPSQPLSCSFGVDRRRQWRGRGAGDLGLLASPFSKVARKVVGFVVGGRPDMARFPLGDGVRQWQARIWELMELGRCPGRRATAEGFFNCDSNISQRVKGLFQLTGRGRLLRRRRRPATGSSTVDGLRRIQGCRCKTIGSFVIFGVDCCPHILYSCICMFFFF